VSLKRGTEKPIPEADYNSQSEEPDEWFGTVRLAVAPG
jgi:hypothetical protein